MQVVSNRSRGDTLIEALFAITVFSLIAVSSISIMNQGSATEQRALEISLVRQQIDGQAETLRFLNSSYVSAYRLGMTNVNMYGENTPASQWFKIKSYLKTSDGLSDFDDTAKCPKKNSASLSKSFVLNTKTAAIVANKFEDPQTYPQVRYTGNEVYSSEGLWIEAINPVVNTSNHQSNASYIDFYISTCWDSPGQSVPIKLRTLVRLYEPRG